MKKKNFKQIRDIIYNNPRADRQDKNNDDKIEDENYEVAKQFLQINKSI